MIVTSENFFLNPKLNEINDNIEKARVEHGCKHGYTREQIETNKL